VTHGEYRFLVLSDLYRMTGNADYEDRIRR